MHLFLSPHLDDAVLSCGGSIHQLTARGESVTVLTTMTGDPPYDLPETSITADLHQRWQAGYQPAKARRQEDRAALETLGAKFIHIPIQDCVYRAVRKEGVVTALYPTEESLWGEIHPEDYALNVLRDIRRPSAVAIYTPLGVGQHVDHRIVRDWGLSLQNVTRVFYEEYPYINAKIEVDRALDFFAPQQMQLEIRELSDADVTAKTRAIACYDSQISTFWSSITEMETQTRQSMLDAGNGTPAERFWRIVK